MCLEGRGEGSDRKTGERQHPESSTRAARRHSDCLRRVVSGPVGPTVDPYPVSSLQVRRPKTTCVPVLEHGR